MKKWSGIALLLVLVMSMLAACGTKNETNGENSNADAGSGTEAKKVLKVGTSADYPPFEYVDTAKSDEIIGFDIDLAKMIADELGYELDIQDMDFNGLIPALQAKSVDFVIAGMDGDDEKRKQVVDFTEPYFIATNYVVFKKDSGFEKAEDLEGKKIGAQTATIQEKSALALQEEYGYSVETRDRVPELIQEIKSGHLDAIVLQNAVSMGYLSANEDLAYFELPEEHKLQLSIAFQKDSEYTPEFNEALKELKESGKVDELITKWFNQ
ncbi:transporter substrate-binding domain-containing protein [Sporosarcina sp. 179-K 3D1 HS]|uniref:transporter substrate-binding domain-containing protein n=1 Tax=Sporosarcina sp. 179-K 3D1 HS TaxID=3232169 RepID=UPI0039A1EE94